MTNAIIESIVSRSTTKYYDPAVTLSDDQIRELVRIATTAGAELPGNWPQKPRRPVADVLDLV
jgi:hypothetical protein